MLLEILRYPDPRLHTVAKPVVRVDAGIDRLVGDMAETMYEAPGVGLAATQVDVHQEIIVIDISESRDDLLTLINPRITAYSGLKTCEEGCLSVPGVYEMVERAETIVVNALDRFGKPFSFEASGLLAVCVQHEMDHLKGKVFVEYLSRLKQSRIRSKLEKQHQRKSVA
jgi:peptide deformylase